MLVLTRKLQEKIQIGDNITITVLRAKGKTVRLGIEAPNDIAVLRGELCFDRDDACDSPEPEVGLEQSSAPEGRRTHATVTPSGKQEWAIVPESRPQAILHRVQRSQVSQVLPQIAESAAPLRDMIVRRRSGALST